jgi:hypothetical protein
MKLIKRKKVSKQYLKLESTVSVLVHCTCDIFFAVPRRKECITTVLGHNFQGTTIMTNFES